ncbi:40S ribosomal protein S21-2, partial [Mucuna pruriens]
MQNEEGKITELYINIAHLDDSGIYNGHISTFALSGFVRAQGDADSGLDRLWQKKKTEPSLRLEELCTKSSGVNDLSSV